MACTRVGISGWRYAGWRGDFYPTGLAQRRELEYAAERMTSIEINGSFYSLQRPSSYAAWRAATPDDFVFSVKGGRYITHLKRLGAAQNPPPQTAGRRRNPARELLRLGRAGPRSQARPGALAAARTAGFRRRRARRL